MGRSWGFYHWGYRQRCDDFFVCGQKWDLTNISYHIVEVYYYGNKRPTIKLIYLKTEVTPSKWPFDGNRDHYVNTIFCWGTSFSDKPSFFDCTFRFLLQSEISRCVKILSNNVYVLKGNHPKQIVPQLACRVHHLAGSHSEPVGRRCGFG